MDRDLGEAAGRLDELDVVQGHEGLQRGVRPFAVDGALLARRRVEGLHRRRRGRALPEGVEAAPVVRLAPFGDVDLRVALLHGHDLPDAGRLVGFHALSAPLRGQQPRGRQRQVADHLAVHPEARPPGKQAIVRVLLQLHRRRGRGLAVRGGRHHEPEEGLHVPSRLAELDRQPVEQLRVRRRLPGDAEFSRGGNEALSEDLRPEAVDVDACRERMVRVCQPLGQPEPVGGGPLGQRREGPRGRRPGPCPPSGRTGRVGECARRVPGPSSPRRRASPSSGPSPPRIRRPGRHAHPGDASPPRRRRQGSSPAGASAVPWSARSAWRRAPRSSAMRLPSTCTSGADNALR